MATPDNTGGNPVTEFETASLALAELSAWSTFAYAAISLVIGAGQIAIVWHGIRTMQRMGERRAAEQDQRHDEAMTALRELIARTGGPADAKGAGA